MSADLGNLGISVEKRSGRKEYLSFDKITSRIKKLCYNLDMRYVDPTVVAVKVVTEVYTGITTTEIDKIAADAAGYLTIQHPDYAVLAARIAVSRLHKETKKKFSEVMTDLYNYKDSTTYENRPLISQFHYEIIMQNAAKLDSSIIYDRDFSYNYFEFETLERSYLMRINGKVVERPQQMLMRVAIGIHGKDIDSTIETYNLLSEKYYIHDLPTLRNAATNTPQLSSSFSVTMKEDSLEGIYETLRKCASITQVSGGIGLDVNSIRTKISRSIGTSVDSTGIAPILKVFNNTAKYVYQGERGLEAMTVYVEPWHPDIYQFLKLRQNCASGESIDVYGDLFVALWIPDLFMQRVRKNQDWCLMCPKRCPGLSDCWGEEFNKLYTSYESKGKYVRKVNAKELYRAIYTAQVETGSPFMVYKDACNKKSNHSNLGTLKSSSLCTEVMQYSSPEEVGVCNLASIALNKFVTRDKEYDFVKLKKVVKMVTKNLDKIIDVNFYPVPEAERSNKRHRPIGIGIQGLADAFLLMRFPYCSAEARKLNIQISETLYYGALEASCELAAEHGPYETYSGSPVSKGILQYDMWDVKPTDLWDWSALKKKIAEYGVRNSLLIALMPTGSTAQILGNNESFEPYASYTRLHSIPSDDFQVVNEHLLFDLIDIKMWSEEMRRNIVSRGGSIQNIPGIPRELKELYKTAWEIPLKPYLEMAAERGAFIDQSQSMNIFVLDPKLCIMNCVNFYGWELGLKTGMYFLKTKLTPRYNLRPYLNNGDDPYLSESSDADYTWSPENSDEN